jgi:soluble lytic murein transglycosylase-like protein
MPATFKSMKNNDNIDDLSEQQQNIMVGTFTLNYLYKKYNDWKLTFTAYNAGSGAVDKANGIPQFTETQAYVKYIVNK